MRTNINILGAILVSAMLISSAFAVDYSTMSTEELAKLRGTMQNATVEERNAFQNEWQKRVQTITQEERQKYLGRPANAGQSNMMQQGGRGMGSGRIGSGGMGGRGQTGQGMGQGRGMRPGGCPRRW